LSTVRPAPLRLLNIAAACVVSITAVIAGSVSSFSQSGPYTIYTADGRRSSLPVRMAGRNEIVSLQQLASIFKITVTEDALVGGLTLKSSGQTVLLIPGQSFASIGPGRVVSLPVPVERGRNGWEGPVELIRQAIGPALGLAVDHRRDRRVILVGDVRLPQISGRGEDQGANSRIVLDVRPATPFAATRSGDRLTLQFKAVAIDLTPITGLEPQFVTSARVEGTSLVFTLGPSTAGFRVDDSSPARIVIELQAPAPPPPPPPVVQNPSAPNTASASPGAPTAPAAPPVLDLTPVGTLRSIVIDPGHGGPDAGAKAPNDVAEKDVVLRLARRLKSAIEGRIGLRVLLTRDSDDEVPLDRRASLANNNKADLFISLHANASVRPTVAGAHVLSLRAADYQVEGPPREPAPLPVPVLGGGSRVIDVVPWDTAQLSSGAQSAAVASILRQRLTELGVPQLAGPTTELPLRTLVGANMPAVMVEVGFLSNPEDARALSESGDRAQKIVDAILLLLGDIRNGIRMPTSAASTSAPAPPGSR
jgi:N-acetylmuramoyl-L-alanine amidase